VSEYASPKKIPGGNALDRLRLLARDDRSVFRDAANQIVARTDKSSAKTPKHAPAGAEPKAPATAEPKAPVLVATAADDKVKRAYELGKEGNVFMNKGDYEGAVASLSQAVGLDSTNADYLYSLASCFAILDKNADAARDYRQFLKLFPNDRRAPLVRESLRSFEATAPQK
jgi:Flp pilus assembly protein TadD